MISAWPKQEFVPGWQPEIPNHGVSVIDALHSDYVMLQPTFRDEWN